MTENKKDIIDLSSKVKDDMMLLEQEMNDIDELYSRSKKLFYMLTDEKNLSVRNTSYVQKMIEALTNLKNSKANLIKERINTHKLVEDLKYKVTKMEKDAGGGDDDLKKVLEILESNSLTNNNILNEDNTTSDEEELSEEELMKILDERINKELGNEDEDSNSDKVEIEDDEEFNLEPETEDEFSSNLVSIQTAMDIPDGCKVKLRASDSELVLFNNEDIELSNYDVDLPIREVIREDGVLEKIVLSETGEVIDILY